MGVMRTGVRVSSGSLMRGFFLLSSFGLLCSAQEFPCTVTQDAGRTRYSVSDFMATKCHYWWTNSSNYALANHDSKGEMVVMKDIRTLLIAGCLKQINYMRDCISEGVPHEANCITTCTGPQGGGGISPYYWVAVGVAVFIILLVTSLCYMRRCRKGYTGVKNEAGEEAERA